MHVIYRGWNQHFTAAILTNFHQNKLKKKMAHLVLVSEVPVVDPEMGGLCEEQDCDEQTPLLRNEETGCSTSPSLQADAKVTLNYSLIPDASLPAQVSFSFFCMDYIVKYQQCEHLKHRCR